MSRTVVPTRERIVGAAAKLFYAEGVRAVNLDAVAAAAGLTKKTLYYHFRSKDDLVAAYLEARDQPNLALFRQWFEAAPGDVAAKTRALFRKLVLAARHPKWRGCGFLRTSAELAAMPGHPAIRIGAAHKKKFEAWMAEVFAAQKLAQPAQLARAVVLLLDGGFATVLLHRDPAYMEAAGDAAHALVSAALTKRPRRPRAKPRSAVRARRRKA
jgi:AcrR family transcriptional regulator